MVIKIDKNILDTIGLVKKSDYKTKITKIKSKIPNVTVLVTSAAPQYKSHRDWKQNSWYY